MWWDLIPRVQSSYQLEQSLANVPACLIGMEACSRAHHLGRKLEKSGHQIRLLPAQYEKLYLKGHKNDFRDAEAIAEATQRPTMRFVPLKSAEQLDLQALHRVRSRLVTQEPRSLIKSEAFSLSEGWQFGKEPRRSDWHLLRVSQHQRIAYRLE